MKTKISFTCIFIVLIALNGCIDKTDSNNATGMNIQNVTNTAIVKDTTIVTNTTIKDINYLTYSNQDFNFSIDYPADWDIIEFNEAIHIINPNKTGGVYTSLTIQILYSNETGGKFASIDDLINSLIDQLKAEVGNYSNISDMTTTISGLYARELIVTYAFKPDLYNTSVNVRQTQIITEKDSYFYVISYASSEDYYDKHIGAYRVFKERFRFDGL